MGNDTYEEIDRVTCLAETMNALKVSFSDGEEKWIPKSVLGPDSVVISLGDYGTLQVKAWFKDKELSDQ
jgi:hypothetical protein